ncbi:hypothetical protein GGG16DRAFT_114254 [Schizophyllum commune]
MSGARSGPHIYSPSLPMKGYGFLERTVAILFGTTFLSAGLAAPWVGASATPTVASASASPSASHHPVSLSQYYSPVRGQPGGSSRILGRAPLANGFVATAAADQLVQIDTKSAEAMHRASGGLVASANEVQKLAQAWRLVRQVPDIFPLLFTCTDARPFPHRVRPRPARVHRHQAQRRCGHVAAHAHTRTVRLRRRPRRCPRALLAAYLRASSAALRDLTIGGQSAEYVARLVKSWGVRPIERLSVFGLELLAEAARALIADIPTHRGPTALSKLMISATSPEWRMHAEDADIADVEYETLARSWPLLQRVEFPGSYDRAVAPRCTMAALGAFAGACTHLESVVLSFDATKDVVPSPSRSDSTVSI